MASSPAVQHESSNLSTDTVAQEIAQDYSNQWHILEQLKSSVAVVDPFAETKRTPTPDSVTNTGTAEDFIEKNKADDNDWYILNDALSTGHVSDAGSDSALEISDLRFNTTDVSNSSNKTLSKISLTNNPPHKDELGKEPQYQEQWRALEELKASVKAMQWASPTSDTSIDAVSQRKDISTRTVLQNDDFVEPHKRTPAGNVNVMSSSIASSGNTSMESGVRSEVSSNLLAVSSSKSETPLEVQHSMIVPPTYHPDYKNTSSDLSLESENLGFAELPNRPATIGNYGAGDGSTYPFNGAVTLVNQTLNPNLQVTQQDMTNQCNANMNPVLGSPVFLVPANDNDSVISKAPISARERLQPDGRDGPDVKAVPPSQAIPGLVNYPISAGSSQNSSGNSSQPSAGSSVFDNNVSDSTSLVNNLILTGTEPLTQNIDNIQPSSGPYNHSFQTQLDTESNESNASLKSFKGTQQRSSLPWQPGSFSTGAYTTSLQSGNDKGTSFSWLSSNGSPTQDLIDLPRVDTNNKTKSQDELREAVLQRIEAHTQIPGLTTSQESVDIRSKSYVDTRPSVSDSGLWSARYLVNGQEIQPSTIQAYFTQSYQDSTASRDLSSTESTPHVHSDEQPTVSTSNFVISTQPEMSTSNTYTTSNITYTPAPVHTTFEPKPSGISQAVATSYTDPNSKTKDVPKKTLTDHTSRPSALTNIRSSLVNNETQSPVSKLLGPNFKATQDYLSKLRTDRLFDSSVESHVSSSRESQVMRTVGQQPSGSFSSLSDDSYLLHKEAWVVQPQGLNLSSNVVDNEAKIREQSFLTLDDRAASASDRGLNSAYSNSKTNELTPISRSIDDISVSMNHDSFQRIPMSVESNGFQFTHNPVSITPSSYSASNSSKQSQGFYSGSYQSNESQISLIQDQLSRPSKNNGVLSRGSATPIMGTMVPTEENEVPLKVSDYTKINDLSYGISTGSDVPSGFSKGSDAAARATVPEHRRREVKQYSSISSYETPLSTLPSDKRSWGQEAEGKNLRYSTGSSPMLQSHDEAEDTDDLLSYEAVLEGDIKYFQSLKNDTERGHFYSSSINSKTEGQTPSHLTGDISSINGTADRDPLRRVPVSLGSTDFGFTNSDEQTRRYHLSLGAGEVRPVEDDYRKPVGTLDSDAEHSSDALDVEDNGSDRHKEESFSSERNTTPATESSSSSIYQPYLPIALRQPPSTERDSELTGNSSSTYGVYDIRLSSGPGSTNRRRKAMGLSPIPGRLPKPSNGIVYVSGDSSPHSMPDEASTDDGFKDDSKDDTLQDDSEEKTLHAFEHDHSEQRRTSSRESRTSRHSAEERELHRQRSSSSKEGSSRSRSRGSSLEEAKMIDDYIGGRKTVQHTKPRHKAKARSRDVSQSDESHSSRDSSKGADLNQMWQRFQESLKSSPRSKKDDSVSSHLSRLSTLLSKPIDIITTSSETDIGQYRKPRSHSYASSSSDVSTESDQPYQATSQHSFTRQIQLKKLLETVNIADIPAFPRLRHRDTTTTNSTFSDTSTSEAPTAATRTVLTRSNRGSRKVSKTPALEPFVQTKPRPAEISTNTRKPRCICAINTSKPSAVEPSPVERNSEKKPQRVEKKIQRPRTLEIGINVPSPKPVREKKATRSKKGYVDVGVQTKSVSDDDTDVSIRSKNDYPKSRSKKTDEDKSSQTTRESSSPKRKERSIVSQTLPGYLSHRTSPSAKHKERHIASQNSTNDSVRLSDQDYMISHNGWDDSNASINPPRKDVKSKGKHLIKRNTSHSKSNAESSLNASAPMWFYPMTKKNYSRPDPSSAIRPGTLRFDEQTLKTYSPPAAPPSTSMQKLSLQEAFHFAKPDFVKRSRARMSRIERNKHIRENGESKATGEERVSKMEIPASKATVNKPQSDPRTEKLHRPKSRQLSKKEIKTLNLKLYNNLPEVKAKKADDKRANFYKTNRLRAKLFDKQVRETLKKRYSA